MASHQKRHMFFFISPLICGVAASILFHLKHKRTSSSATTCPLDSAPPSSISLGPEIKYDVFVNFRGDIRSGFLSHLRAELSRQKIDCFVDDQKLEKGDKISSTLLNAIKKSEISLAVFSENYASSRWCLEELEQIMQCMKNQGQIVVTIFYKVDPSFVRHQTGSFKYAFDKLGKRFDKHSLRKWKTALKEACDFSAFVSSDYPTEAILIKEVVKHVSKVLREKRGPSDLKGFVGMHEHIQYLEARLRTKPEGIFIIGIWGMGGMGKTTIAEKLFDRLCNKYEGSHFLNVREELNKYGSIRQLKNELLSELLNEKVQDVMVSDISMDIKKRLHRKKVFVVLDDIHESDQLEILTGGHAWFGSGSIIIMTSRDKHVFSKECDDIYKVKPLNSEQALQLLEIVLGEDCLVKEQERHELLAMVVEYAKGVPLAIKVLGRSLWNKDKDGWKSKLEKLEKIPDAKIQELLELSYNELKDDQHEEIFLYLACFFRAEFKSQITFLLDACGYSTIDGLGVLQDKALINISNKGFVTMHDLIRDMGCEVVRKKSLKDLGQRIHLFDANDICEVFEKNMGTGTIESIRLKSVSLKNDLHFGPQAFAGMNNLKLLKFRGHLSIDKCKLWPPEEGFESLPNELRSFEWIFYPLTSFPLRCCVKYLVEINFAQSNLQKLWDGVQDLPELKVICLSFSAKLTELPDLSKAPKLERVSLQGCAMLSHVPLWPNRNMVEQDMTEYKEAKKISFESQVSLTSFSTEESEKHDHLDSCGMSSVIKSSVKYYVLQSLQFLNLSFCFSLIELPDEIGFCLPSLQMLGLAYSKVKTLPASIKHLSKLTSLRVNCCSWLRYIPELPPSIQYLDAYECTDLETLQFITSNSMPLSHQKKVLIDLCNCVKLGEHTLEAAAMHYKLTTQRILLVGREDEDAGLHFPGSKVPECFRGYGTRLYSESVLLELPLHYKALGFIFYFVTQQKKDSIIWSKLKCHIKLGNVQKVEFIGYGRRFIPRRVSSDHVFLWYKRSLCPEIMEEVSRIKASATTDDLCPKVCFKLLRRVFRPSPSIKEWGVYPIFISSESHDIIDTKRCPNLIGSCDDNHDDSNCARALSRNIIPVNS